MCGDGFLILHPSPERVDGLWAHSSHIRAELGPVISKSNYLAIIKSNVSTGNELANPLADLKEPSDFCISS